MMIIANTLTLALTLTPANFVHQYYSGDFLFCPPKIQKLSKLRLGRFTQCFSRILNMKRTGLMLVLALVFLEWLVSAFIFIWQNPYLQAFFPLPLII